VAAIEQHYADRLADQVERLAHHALRGEVWDKAVAYCRQAGDKAVARSAGREAVACFEQALVAVEHLPEGRERQEQAIDVRFGLRHALGQRLENDRVLDDRYPPCRQGLRWIPPIAIELDKATEHPVMRVRLYREQNAHTRYLTEDPGLGLPFSAPAGASASTSQGACRA
jgi:hypothetical protein